MKQDKSKETGLPISVVPYAGTWIETENTGIRPNNGRVVPYAGTWIETTIEDFMKKFIEVVPYAGTWIETILAVVTSAAA